MRYENTSAEFFESMYLRNSDPWNFEHSSYEQGRHAAAVDALQRRHYERAFEPGCSIGVLTQSLARFCKYVDAMDISLTAVSRAQERCRNLPRVRVWRGALPEAIPDGMFDLIVFCEIGYYFDDRDLDTLTARLVEKLCLGGYFLAEHWLGVSADHILSGDRVHEIVRSNPKLLLEEEKRFPSFRLDRLVRR